MSIFEGTTVSDPVVIKDTQAIDKGESINGIDVEIYRFLGVNPLETGDVEQLKTVAKWASEGAKSPSDALLKLRQLERGLGAPKPDESRVGKLYNNIRLKTSINGLKQQMKSEVDNVKTKAAKSIDSTVATHSNKISELSSKLRDAKASLAEATRQSKLHATNTAMNIKNKYKAEIIELEKMAQAYK